MNPTEKLMALQNHSLEIIEKAHVNFKKSPKERITLGYVQGRLEALDSYFQEFKSVDEKIVTSVSKEDKSKLSYFKEEVFDSFEERFYIYKGELKTVLQKFSTEGKGKQGIQGARDSQPIQGTSEIRLPHVTIPCFSGDYTEWQSFHDLFTSMINNNSSLDDVQKMHYLKVNLKGDAEVLLRQFPITGENYSQAWAILKKRYDNKRYIANCLFKKFFAQKTIVQESATALKQLLDTSVECLNALKNLGLPTPQWDAIVIYMVVSKLDPGTHKHWEELISGDESAVFPTFEKLKSFLETRFRTLEMVEPVGKSYKPHQPKTFHVTTNDTECAFCKDEHLIHHCKQFAKRPVDERYEFVRNNNLCYNCLIPNHAVWRCKQKTSCQVCKRRHHSLLHRDTKVLEEKQENNNADMTKGDSMVVAHVRPSGDEHERNILLATAQVEVASNCGQPQVCRALIDQGSEASFVTARVVELLKLKKSAVSGVVSGISEDNNMCIKSKVELQISSRYEPDFAVNVKAYVIKSLSRSLPDREINCKRWPQLDNMKLADPTFNTPSRVDILLGADVFGKIIDSGFMKGPGDVVAQYTHLGWILSGDTNTTSSSSRRISSFHVTLQVEEDNNETEVYTNMKTWPREEELCEEVYKTTTPNDDTGRYIVHLPLKKSVEDTVKSCGETKQPTIGIFKQLAENSDEIKTVKKERTKVIHDYLELGNIKKAEVEDETRTINLTHHAVATEDGDTPKMHIVVTASVKSANRICFNNASMTGPILQPGLRHLAKHWRTHKICVFGDDAKKYRQVWMSHKHTDLQRIVWRDEPPEKIESYKLLTVTAAAPYLAGRTLTQFADDEAYTYFRAAPVVKNSFCMDDLVTGHEHVSEIKKLCHEINILLRAGGFDMQKWSIKYEELLEFLRDDNTSEEPENKIEMELDKVIKISKLTKCGNEEVFKMMLHLPECRILTEVKISEIGTLSYTLSWLAPIVITVQVMRQRLSLYSRGCDDELPPEIIEEWKNYGEELHDQSQTIQILPWAGLTTNGKDVPLEVFADASCHLVTDVTECPQVVDEEDVIRVILLATKTRASLKQLKVPRSQAIIGEDLRDISDLPTIFIDKIHVLKDSTTVWSWLKTRRPIYAKNGAADVTQHEDNFKQKRVHVQSVDKSTDLASGDVKSGGMASSNMWRTGSKLLISKDEGFERIRISQADRESKNTFNQRLKDNPDRKVLSSTFILKRFLAPCFRLLRYIEKPKGERFLKTTKFKDEVVMQCVKYYQYLGIKDLKENRRLKMEQLLASSVTPRHARVKMKSILDARSDLP